MTLEPWLILWMALVAGEARVHSMSFMSVKHFSDKAACQEYLDKTEPRMPDYILGTLNAPIETEVSVHGICEIDGKPS